MTTEDLSQYSPKTQELWKLADPCQLCPRLCMAHRGTNAKGFCGIGIYPLVSSAGPHFGEESVLVGHGGSGTIFLTGCNLGCIFCQNFDISHECYGQLISIKQLAHTMLHLQDIGCVNINFVTPTHMIHAICAAIEQARDLGLNLPIVYNSGGYDRKEILQKLENYIDIYMPDLKFADPQISAQLCEAPDYPQQSQAAIQEMYRQVGDLTVDNGLAKRGLLVRHLVLPHNLAGSTHIIDFLADQISPQTAINVMDQYRPCYQACTDPQLNRRPTVHEVQQVRTYAQQKGLRLID